ncbi:hypothetical protein FXO37_14746 [Capsicum annuum]|nr:hypothetical protein FXO37_14746 [Capsicum annuum]
MVKRNKQTTNFAAEMKEIRVLVERLFAELNARHDKFDQAIVELKACIESLRAHENGEKGVESTINALSALQLDILRGYYVTGYYGKLPWTVLMGEGDTFHNFINESLADNVVEAVSFTH